MSIDGDITDSELDAFAAQLVARNRVDTRLAAIRDLWAAAVPRLTSSPHSMAALRSALDKLAERQVIELPSGSWDRSSNPPLPKFVRMPSARRPHRPPQHRGYPWRSELGWVASLRNVTDGQLEQLRAINAWLATANDTLVVPHRVRSAEVLGDEKALDRLARGVLFGDGRLTFDLLRCKRLPPPLPAAVVGDGPDVLVVENSDPYWMAVESLRAVSGHQIGAVIWGSGNTFPAQVPALGVDVAGRGPVTGTVWYWGDLDPKGIHIAVAAARVAAELGVAPVRPPIALWDAHRTCPITSSDGFPWDDTGAEWFGPRQWATFEPVRSARGRISQEACAPTAISSWLHALLPADG
jgi:hypothetical protein